MTNHSNSKRITVALLLFLSLSTMALTQEAINCPADETNTRNIYETHDHGEETELIEGEVVTQKQSVYMGLQNKRIFCVVADDSDSDATKIRNYNIDDSGNVLIEQYDTGVPILKYFVDNNNILLVVQANETDIELWESSIDATSGAISATDSSKKFPFSGLQGNLTSDISYSNNDIIHYYENEIYLERSNRIIDRYTQGSGVLEYDTSIELEDASTDVKCLDDKYCFDVINGALYAWATGAKIELSETNAILPGSDYFTYAGWEVIVSHDEDSNVVYLSIFIDDNDDESTLTEHQANDYTFSNEVALYSSETPAYSTINLMAYDGETIQILKSHYYMGVPRIITASFSSASDAVTQLGVIDTIKSVAFANPSIFALKADQIVKIALLYDEGTPEAAVETVVEIPLEETGSDVSIVTPIMLSQKAQDNIAAVEDLSSLFTLVTVQCICISEGEMAMECFESGNCLFMASMTEQDCTTGEEAEADAP